MEGYRLLNSKLEALDFDVEQAAEQELAGTGMNNSPNKQGVPAIAEEGEDTYEATDDY
jgi:outer membrane murein-binding lipoprotein Lpp